MRQLVKQLIPNAIIQRKLKPGGENSVLLTFDDGPNPQFTVPILDILNRYNVKACFFVVGKCIKEYPDILTEIHKQGHLIGNHSYDHYGGEMLSSKSFEDDLMQCQHLIKEKIGITPLYFRPPLGRISLKYLYISRQLGLSNIFWSREGGEWGDNKHLGAKEILSELCSTVQGRDIILFHDNHHLLPEILNDFLPFLIEKKLDVTRSTDFL